MINHFLYSVKVWKAFIILMVLALSVGEGLSIGKTNFLIGGIVLSIPIALLGGFYILKNVEKGPLLIILVAGFIPLGLSTGTESKIMASLILTMVLVGAWLLNMLVIDHRVRLFPSMINLPLIAFISVAVIAWVWSLLFRDPLVVTTSTFPFVQAASTLVMVLLPLCTLLVGNLVRDEKMLKWMVGLILLIVGVDLVVRFSGVDFPINANGITHMWAITFAFSMALFLKGLKLYQRVLLLGLVGASIVWGFILHLTWYSGWIPGFICIGVISFLKSKRLFLGLILCLVLVVYFNFSYFSDNLDFKQSNDVDTRWAAWQVNWQVTSNHLLFGTGPGGYAAYYMTYFPLTAMATHNNYIDIIAETGITGIMLYFWLFLSMIFLGYRVLRKVRGRGDFLETLVMGAFSGAIGCVVIMGFGDWLIPFAYTQTIAGYNYEVYSWLFLGTLIVADRLTQNLPQPVTAAAHVLPAETQKSIRIPTLFLVKHRNRRS